MVKPPKEYVRCPMCNHLVDPFKPKNLDMRELRFGIWRKWMMGYKDIRWEKVDQTLEEQLNLVLTFKTNCKMLLEILETEIARLRRETDRIVPDVWVGAVPDPMIESPVDQVLVDVRWSSG